jgi:hypothetical protein
MTNCCSYWEDGLLSQSFVLKYCQVLFQKLKLSVNTFVCFVIIKERTRKENAENGDLIKTIGQRSLESEENCVMRGSISRYM